MKIPWRWGQSWTVYSSI